MIRRRRITNAIRALFNFTIFIDLKILYLHQHFKFPWEAGSSRPYYLAKVLADSGHEVQVLCGGVRAELKEIEGYSVRRFQIPYSNKMGALKRGRSFLRFNRKAWFWAKNKDFDLCYASSTPLTVGILARKLKKNKNLPYIFEVRDLWPRAPIELGAIKLNTIKRGLYRLERKIYKDAEHVITLSPGMIQDLKFRFPELKCSLISNFSDPLLFASSENKENENKINSVNIIYFGAIGRANGLSKLINLAEALNAARVKNSISIYGEGSEKNKLQNLINSKQLSNILIHESIAKLEVPKKLNEASFSYISFSDEPVLQTNSPNKLFDSLAAGLIPIINVEGWIKELLEDINLGLYHDAKHTDSTVNQLKNFLKKPERIEAESKIARKLFEENYTIKITGKKLLEVIESTQK